MLSRTNPADPFASSSSISFSSLSLRTLFLSCRSFSVRRPLFSIASALFDKNAGVGWASRSCLWTLGGSRQRLPVPEMLLWDTRGGGTSLQQSLPRLPLQHPASSLGLPETAVASVLTPHSAQFWCSISSFRINTCKSVSKQEALTPFRINTCEKQGGGG